MKLTKCPFKEKNIFCVNTAVSMPYIFLIEDLMLISVYVYSNLEFIEQFYISPFIKFSQYIDEVDREGF